MMWPDDIDAPYTRLRKYDRGKRGNPVLEEAEAREPVDRARLHHSCIHHVVTTWLPLFDGLPHGRIRCFKRILGEQRLRRAQRYGEAASGRRADS
jgi:hypothetical protein